MIKMTHIEYVLTAFFALKETVEKFAITIIRSWNIYEKTIKDNFIIGIVYYDAFSYSSTLFVCA